MGEQFLVGNALLPVRELSRVRLSSVRPTSVRLSRAGGEDLDAQINAFVADEHPSPGDQLQHLRRPLHAERASHARAVAWISPTRSGPSICLGHEWTSKFRASGSS